VLEVSTIHVYSKMGVRTLSIAWGTGREVTVSLEASKSLITPENETEREFRR